MTYIDTITTMDELFEAWEEKHRTEEDTSYLAHNIPKHIFLPDGIIDPVQYASADRKILFIAKEANWYQDDGDSNESVKTMFWHRKVAFDEVPKTQFSYRLSMLANAIASEKTNDYTVVDKSHEILQTVAVMNLNKRGGYSYCIWDTLNRYVSTYREYIRQQIKLMAPDLIVCCGYDVMWLLEEYDLAPNCDQKIWVYHPSYFAISDENYLLQLKCAMHGKKWIPARNGNVEVSVVTPTKGIIFDTNKTYSDDATMDMLLSSKISAYGDASKLIDSFNVGDYVFFSVKGIGVVAAGKVISHTEEVCHTDFTEKYKVVEFISPLAEQMPHGEENLKALSWGEITTLLHHGFYYARTDKRPYLTEEECHVLIKALEELYQQKIQINQARFLGKENWPIEKYPL